MPWLWGKQGCCDNVLAITSFDNVIGWPLTPNREDLMEMEVAPHGNDDVRSTNWGSTGTPPWQRDHQPPPEPVSRALCLSIALPTIHHYHCHYGSGTPRPMQICGSNDRKRSITRHPLQCSPLYVDLLLHASPTPSAAGRLRIAPKPVTVVRETRPSRTPTAGCYSADGRFTFAAGRLSTCIALSW